MDEPRARGISLWLMPEGRARERLAALIDRLATRLGTAAFAPHVTLLPGLPGPETEVLDGARVDVTTVGLDDEDAVGAGPGEVVLYASGSSARLTEVTDKRPCDAVIVAIVDTLEVGGAVTYSKAGVG